MIKLSSIELTSSEISALRWASGRYGWGDLIHHVEDNGAIEWSEAESWEWRDAVDQDDRPFSCASGDLEEKLQAIYDSIV